MQKHFVMFLILGFLTTTYLTAQEAGSSQSKPSESFSGDSALGTMKANGVEMGPHMKMTTLRNLQPGDRERAEEVVEAARKFAAKYTDYKTALADGFQIFMPGVPQEQYHFTNYAYALEARIHFDPNRPTSLLYEKVGDGYKLIGVMYTAPPNATEDQLNARIPLSIARWHAHVNLCLSPSLGQSLGIAHPRFGPAGSIVNREDCDTAGGTFVPQLFGWMVHVYPFEGSVRDIWSVQRQNEP